MTRTITYPDGRDPLVQRWTWTYDPHAIMIAVHPCELPEDHPQYDPEVQCPVQVPNLAGLAKNAARNALQALGLVFKESANPATTDNPALDNTVKSQSIPPDTWLDPGAEVTVTLWVYEAP